MKSDNIAEKFSPDASGFSAESDKLRVMDAEACASVLGYGLALVRVPVPVLVLPEKSESTMKEQVMIKP